MNGSSINDTQTDGDMADAESRLVKVLTQWLIAVQNEKAEPYLTAADRRVLLALMKQDKR